MGEKPSPKRPDVHEHLQIACRVALISRLCFDILKWYGFCKNMNFEVKYTCLILAFPKALILPEDRKQDSTT